MQKLTLLLPDDTAATLAAIAAEGRHKSTAELARSIIQAVLADDQTEHTQVVKKRSRNQNPDRAAAVGS